jgi:hypothetical protein
MENKNENVIIIKSETPNRYLYDGILFKMFLKG